jgi:hypothetical protein
VKKPETTAGLGGTKGKVAFKFTGVTNEDVIQIYVKNQAILAGDGDQNYSTGQLDLSGTNSINVDRIKDNVHLSNATALEVTLDAYVGGNDTFTVSFIQQSSNVNGAGFSTGERYVTAAALSGAVSDASQGTFTRGGIGTDDIMTLTVGSNTVTAVLSANTSGTDIASGGGLVSGVALALVTAWDAKYSATGTASASALVSVQLATASNEDENRIIIVGLDPGSSTGGLAVSFSVANSTTGPTSTTHTGSSLDYVIGATQDTSDNALVSDDLIVTLESIKSGTVLNRVKTATGGTTAGNYFMSFSGNLAMTTLTASANLSNATDPYVGHWIKNTESRSDVRPAEGATQGSGDDEDFSRVHWLSS